MYEKSCRCGDTKKSFKIDIGEFFINDCCTSKGYDHLGKKEVDPEDLGLNKDKLNEDLNSFETQNLIVDDEGEQPDPNEETVQDEQSSEESLDGSEEVDMDKEVEEAIAETSSSDYEISHDLPAPVEDQAKEPVKKKRTYNRGGNLKK